MSKERKRRRQRVASREPRQPETAESPSGWTAEFKTVEPARLQPIPLALWRTTLERLRSEFQNTHEHHGPLRCPLVQTSSSKTEPHEPPFDRDAAPHAFRGCIYSHFRWHKTPGGKPIYLEHPIIDAGGKPIVDSQGRGLSCAMPTSRMWPYLGQPGASHLFSGLAERAGRVLLTAAVDTVSWIPEDTLSTNKDEPRWIWTVFDLAWRGMHPSLQAERKIWIKPSKPLPDIKCDIVYVPYDVKQLRALREVEPVYDFPEAWCDRLPGFFFSELPDVFTASLDLIDFLLATSSQSDDEAHPRKPASGSVEPATDPEPVDQLKPSHAKAKALYDWAMEHIDGAEKMTYAELFEKLTDDRRCAGEGLPNNAEAFARYCRAAGVRRNSPRHEKGATRSVRRSSDL